MTHAAMSSSETPLSVVDDDRLPAAGACGSNSQDGMGLIGSGSVLMKSR
jgi:hypothetical protein